MFITDIRHEFLQFRPKVNLTINGLSSIYCADYKQNRYVSRYTERKVLVWFSRFDDEFLKMVSRKVLKIYLISENMDNYDSKKLEI